MFHRCVGALEGQSSVLLRILGIGHFGAIVAAGLMLCAAPAAQATLIGDEITCAYTGAFPCDSPSATVGAGDEFRLDDIIPVFRIDVGASSFLLQNISGITLPLSSGQVLTIGDLEWVGLSGEITGIENFGSDTAGLIAADVVCGSGSCTIDFSNTLWPVAGTVVFDLVTRSRSGAHHPRPLRHRPRRAGLHDKTA